MNGAPDQREKDRRTRPQQGPLSRAMCFMVADSLPPSPLIESHASLCADRVKQERQQGKEKMHAAGAALVYRARGLTGVSYRIVGCRP